MKKVHLCLWILLLVLLSIPAGFLTIITEEPYTPRSEYLLIFIGGTIACSIVVGSLSLIPFFVLKRQNSNLALKRGLLCYTFFVVALIAVASFRFPEAMKKRDRYHFLEYYEPVFKKLILEEIELGSEHLPASVLKHKQEICSCILFEISYNDGIIDELRKVKDPESFFLKNKKINQIKKECMDLYKE